MHVNRRVPGCGFKPRDVVVGWKPGFYWGGDSEVGEIRYFSKIFLIFGFWFLGGPGLQ